MTFVSIRNAVCVSSIVLALAAGSQTLADSGAAHKVKQTPPVKMGTSGGSRNDISGPYCCGGTMGALVIRDGVLCILSNNHILARSGSAASGEDTVQPALIDTNCSSTNSNIIGDYAGNLVPLGTANVDAALSIARSGMVDATGAILDIGVPCSNIQAPALNLPVMKSGRTTGFRTGTITSVNTSVTIQYQKKCNGGQRFNVSFTNQIVTTAMSAGGDSGSLLISNDGTPNPVGLLFAGSNSITIHNPAQSVANAFSAGGHSFSFVGAGCGGLAPDALPPGPTDVDFTTALVIKIAHEDTLMRRPGVWGVGVGSKADDLTKAAIVVYMEPPANDHVPGLPDQIDGVDVRVVYTDPIVAH